MPHGPNRRRTAPRFAPLALWLALSAGCQRPIVQQVDPVPVAPVPPASPSGPAAALRPVAPPATET